MYQLKRYGKGPIKGDFFHRLPQCCSVVSAADAKQVCCDLNRLEHGMILINVPNFYLILFEIVAPGVFCYITTH